MANVWEIAIKLTGNAKSDLKDIGDAGTRSLKELEGEAKDAATQLDHVSDKAKSADKALDNMGTSAQKGGGHLKTIAATAGGFLVAEGVMKLGGFLLDAAKAAADDEQATIRMDKALENYNDSVLGANASEEIRAKSLEALKTSTEGLIQVGQDLGFSDDQIRESYQKLLAATGSQTDAMDRLSAAQDLARGTGMDLSTASKMLGKLSDENIQVFKKLGITIKDGATEADVLATVQAKFGGQADAYAKSTAGQFEVTSIRLSELKEAIGAKLLPIMGALGAMLLDTVVPALEDAVKIASKWIDEGVAKWGPTISAFIDETGPKVKAYFESLMSMVESVVGFIDRNWNLIGPIVNAVLDDILNTLKLWIDLVSGVFQIFADVLSGDWEAAWTHLKELAGTLLDDILALIKGRIELWRSIGAAVLALFKWIGEQALEGISKLPDLLKSLGEKALRALIDAAKAVWEAEKRLYTEVIPNFIRDAIPKIVEVSKDLGTKILKALWDAVKAAWDAEKKFYTEILPNFIRDAAPAAADKAKELGQKAIESLWSGVKSAWDAGKNFLTDTIPSAISGAAHFFTDAGSALGKALLDGISSALSSTASLAGNVGQAVLDAVKRLVNSQVIDRINRSLEFSFDTHIPGVGSISINPPDIPRLARGTSFWGGGAAMMNEHGGETAILPRGTRVLSADATRRAGSGQSAPSVVVNYNGPVTIVPDERGHDKMSQDVGYGVASALMARGLYAA